MNEGFSFAIKYFYIISNFTQRWTHKTHIGRKISICAAEAGSKMLMQTIMETKFVPLRQFQDYLTSPVEHRKPTEIKK